ncbi:MAG TPA: serpin family protein [Bacteroidetes bacterium]|nr:serpin family protein [Bacteroidota bacterium]
MTRIVLFIVFLLIPICSCEKNNPDNLPDEPIPIELTVSQKELVRADNAFGFDIFRLIMQDTDDENVMISPLSISYALSMTLNGANGVTRDSMMKALRYYNISLEEINNSYKDLTDKLMKVDKRVISEIANSVWVEERLRVKQAFMDSLTEYFNAEVHDFSVSDPDIVDIINGWIEDNTHGKIKDMINELPADIAMLLINAIYFNGKWKYEFDRDNTTDMPFYPESGPEVSVPMMNQEVTVKINSQAEFMLLELPYGQGNYVMDIILPEDGFTSSDIIPMLNAEDWADWTENMYKTSIDLFMPRFKYEFKTELKNVLSAMGMGIAFTPFAADFSNISEQDLFISKVLHQTFIETNEEGTEAAAATVVMMELTSVPSGPLVVKLDKPFIYIIRETSTNSIVFMGKTGNPAN